MEDALKINGLSVAREVVETIIKLTVEKTEGVASIGGAADVPGVINYLGKKTAAPAPIGIKVEDDELCIAVRITAFFGYPFVKLAEDIRERVAMAISSQVGAQVKSVDVFIDGLVFTKE